MIIGLGSFPKFLVMLSAQVVIHVLGEGPKSLALKVH